MTFWSLVITIDYNDHPTPGKLYMAHRINKQYGNDGFFIMIVTVW